MDKQPDEMEKSISVLIVVLYLKLGGLERMVIQLIKGLSEKGYKVTLVCIEEAGSLMHQLDRKNVDLYILNKPPGFHFNVAQKIAAIAKQNKIDLLHSHNSAPHLYCALAKLLSGNRLKLVHTKHGRDDPGNSRLVLKNRLASLLSNKVVAVSRDAMDVCRDIESVNPEKLQFIPNGIDLSDYRDVNREAQKLRFSRGEYRLVTVGRLSSEKNQQLMLHALKQVIQQYPGCRLTICGTGREQDALAALALELGVQQHVFFAGMVEDIPGELEQHDLFLLSSTTEGMPLSVIEAMAAGLPIVSTHVGGLGELIEQEKNGLLTPSGDVLQFANAITNLLGSPDKLTRFGEAAAEKSRKKYGLAGMVSDYSELYLEVVNQPRS